MPGPDSEEEKPEASEPRGDEAEQGPSDDDPPAGFSDEAPEDSAASADFVEPGLDESQLAEACLGAIEEEVGCVDDETGTPGDDEAAAASDEFAGEGHLLDGSDPADPPGVTDDLFDADDGRSAISDPGEEGIEDDAPGELDDGPFPPGAMAEDTKTGEPLGTDEAPFEASSGRRPAAAPARRVVPLPSLPFEARATAAAWRSGRLHVFADRRASDPDGVYEWDGEHGWRPIAPSLGMEGDEAQRVAGILWGGPRGSAAAESTLFAATDRGMIFRWEAGGLPAAPASWRVEHAYVAPGGRPSSWLPLGVSRSPFLLVPSGIPGGGLWAWRPGGPLLAAEADGSWRWADEGRALRAFAADPRQPQAALFFTDDDDAAGMRLFGGPTVDLPLDAAEVVGAPGACAAIRGGRILLGCTDPAAELLESGDLGATWSRVDDVRGVRSIAFAGADGPAIVLACDPSDEMDQIVVVAAGARATVVLRASDLGRTRDEPARSAGRIDCVAASDSAPGEVCVIREGRVFLLPGVSGGERASGGAAGGVP